MIREKGQLPPVSVRRIAKPLTRRLACAHALLVALSLSATAGEVTLEDVVRTVLQRSVNVELEQQNIRENEAQLRQAWGKFDWGTFATAKATRRAVPGESDGSLSSDTETDTVCDATAGLSKTFRNGVSVRPAFSITSGTSSESADALSQSVTGFGIGIVIPLLRGAGRDNAAVAELALQAKVKASEYGTAFATQRLLQTAVRTYWRCLAVQRTLDILLRQDKDITDLNKSLKQMVARGELPRLEQQETIADAAMRGLDINSTRQSLFSARGELAIALGSNVQIEADLPLAAGALPNIEAIPASVATELEYIELARAKRADLEAMKRVAQSEDIRMHEARNSLKPSLDIVLDQESLSLRYAKSLNANTEKGRLAERSVAVHVAQFNLQLLLQAIQFDVQNVLYNLRLQSENFRMATKTFQLLQDISDDRDRQVAFGTAGRGSQISIVNRLAQTQRQILDAKMQYAVALSELRLITGTIVIDDSQSPAQLAHDFQQLPAIRRMGGTKPWRVAAI